ncbi:MAG: hypothetical protein C4288_22850 [Leptolyngbya sp. ERB_1_1]
MLDIGDEDSSHPLFYLPFTKRHYPLSELEQNAKHVLYPFITGWHPKLFELAGTDFKRITELKRKIVGRLKETWILVENYEKASYYQGLMHFQEQYQYPLRIFTLNYDLCVERACSKAKIERGFNETRMLDVRRFEDDQDQTVDLLLYKVHGSIDWKKDKYGSLTFSDEAGSVSVRELEIIFGTSQKLQYADPYLFIIHEFRKYCRKAKLILVIGYSFGDDHINGIMTQALSQDSDRRIVSVAPSQDGEKLKQYIADKLSVLPTQVEVVLETAKTFMEQTLHLDYLEKFVPLEESIF